MAFDHSKHIGTPQYCSLDLRDLFRGEENTLTIFHPLYSKKLHLVNQRDIWG